YRPEQVLGRSLFDFVLPQYHDLIRTAITRAWGGEEPANYEVQVAGASGAPIWVSGRLSAVRQERRPVALITAVRDITERKQVEESLRLSHERFQLLARATGDGIWDLDLVTGDTWW